MAAAKTRGPGGRPTRLSEPVVTALVRQIAAGAGLDAAARSLGLGPKNGKTLARTGLLRATGGS
jgi:hypothetical protein